MMINARSKPMTKAFGRDFNQARQQQGFRSQAHLDAFYRHYDHTCQCAECQQPGPSVAIDDGFQPTQNRCDVARTLETEMWAISDGRAA
jgi:hypothetical protein